MKQKIFIIIAIVGLVLSSCGEVFNNITPEGPISDETHLITGIEAISASDAFTVEIIRSEDEKVIISTQENIHQYVRLIKTGDHLYLDVYGANIKGAATLKATVYTKNAGYFEGSGASHFITQDTMEYRRIIIELSGASTFTGNVMVHEELLVELSGASLVSLGGSANETTLEASGASTFENYNFETNYLLAELSGSSKARLTIHEKIHLEASGASHLYYKGGASIQYADLSGGSGYQQIEE